MCLGWNSEVGNPKNTGTHGVSEKRLSVFPMANPAFALELCHMTFKFFVLHAPYEVKQEKYKEIGIAFLSLFGRF